ncbi:MAG: TetR/AcrR family transcriptional regulator [Caulobacteraceae bacterium]
MSLRQRKKLATRNALIRTARHLFGKKGYENTTLEEICERVPIHVTTFFSYFDSKEELAFARTLESLQAFCDQIHNRPAGVDVLTAWWKFFYSFGLRDREEESTLMLRMEEVPALRNRYANILRQYEDEMTKALALEAGRDPAADLYSQLFASTLLGTIIAGAHWHRAVLGQDARMADTSIVTKLILSRFPSREEIDDIGLKLAVAGKRPRKGPAPSARPRPRRSGDHPSQPPSE